MTRTYKITCLIAISIIIIIGLAFLVYGALTPSKEPIVKTKVGMFQGLHAMDGTYDMYLGIPYATVNMSSIFGPAIPQEKFDNIYLATNASFICPQYDELNKIVTGTLDCLRLNVFTPKFTKTKQRHPVLVFIHGDDNYLEFCETDFYGPKYLMKHGIILVTLNYRLGPYGFLCSNEANICNEGLKDQILALKWIKDNIAHFGGDPRKVTIAGTGSGGECVNMHLLYEKEDLFHKVIIDSGIYLNNYDENESPVMDLAEALEFDGENETAALDFLQKQNIDDVITISVKLKINYGPSIESVHENAFITNEKSGIDDREVPILISHSSNEMLTEYYKLDFRQRSEFQDIFYDELEKRFDIEEHELREIELDVRNFYIKGEKVSEENKASIIHFVSDIRCNYPTKRMIEEYLKKDKYNIYYSIFSYDGKRNCAKKIYNISLPGTTKGDVLGYLFDFRYLEGPDSDDQRMIDYMTTLWSNFVKYGDPTPPKSNTLSIKWLPVTREKLNYLEITTNLTNKISPFPNRTEFWDTMFAVYGNNERITRNIEPWRNNKSYT